VQWKGDCGYCVWLLPPPTSPEGIDPPALSLQHIWASQAQAQSNSDFPRFGLLYSVVRVPVCSEFGTSRTKLKGNLVGVAARSLVQLAQLFCKDGFSEWRWTMFKHGPRWIPVFKCPLLLVTANSCPPHLPKPLCDLPWLVASWRGSSGEIA